MFRWATNGNIDFHCLRSEEPSGASCGRRPLPLRGADLCLQVLGVLCLQVQMGEIEPLITLFLN